jgi:hypothetical protein
MNRLNEFFDAVPEILRPKVTRARRQPREVLSPADAPAEPANLFDGEKRYRRHLSRLRRNYPPRVAAEQIRLKVLARDRVELERLRESLPPLQPMGWAEEQALALHLPALQRRHRRLSRLIGELERGEVLAWAPAAARAMAESVAGTVRSIRQSLDEPAEEESEEQDSQPAWHPPPPPEQLPAGAIYYAAHQSTASRVIDDPDQQRRLEQFEAEELRELQELMAGLGKDESLLADPLQFGAILGGRAELPPRAIGGLLRLLHYKERHVGGMISSYRPAWERMRQRAEAQLADQTKESAAAQTLQRRISQLQASIHARVRELRRASG